MPKPATSITLPVERAAQLHTLADALGVTVSEAVEHLINREIAAGTIPDELPGFEIKIAEKHVWLTMPDFGFPPLHPAHARYVADLLCHIADHGTAGRGNVLGLADGMRLIVGRKGRGVLLIGQDDALDRTCKASMTPQMARDLARQIRKAANQAQGRKH